MAPTLTDIERKILDYMVEYLRSNTYQPSIREIGERFGIKSTKTVSEHLQALADKGFLERDPSRSRGVRLLGIDLRADTVSVPCYRDLPADRTALGERAEMHLALDRRLGGRRGAFFVQARGQELAALGVMEGDFVLVEPVDSEALAEGDVVAAKLEGRPAYHRISRNGLGATLETLGSGGRVTAVTDVASLSVIGKVTALFRRLEAEAVRLSLTAH